MLSPELKILIGLIGIADPDARAEAAESALVALEHGSAAMGAEKILREAASKPLAERPARSYIGALRERACIEMEYDHA